MPARVQDDIDYHGKISQSMTAERTALASALIPVTPYILVACIDHIEFVSGENLS